MPCESNSSINSYLNLNGVESNLNRPSTPVRFNGSALFYWKDGPSSLEIRVGPVRFTSIFFRISRLFPRDKTSRRTHRRRLVNPPTRKIFRRRAPTSRVLVPAPTADSVLVLTSLFVQNQARSIRASNLHFVPTRILYMLIEEMCFVDVLGDRNGVFVLSSCEIRDKTLFCVCLHECSWGIRLVVGAILHNLFYELRGFLLKWNGIVQFCSSNLRLDIRMMQSAKSNACPWWMFLMRWNFWTSQFGDELKMYANRN